VRLLWLAAYPFEFVVEKTKSRPHPIPWVTEMAKYIAKDYDLTILNSSWRAKQTLSIERDGIKFVFIKTPNPLINLITFNLLKIIRLRRWLKSNVHSYDLMHINGVEYQFGYSARNLAIPSVVSIQGLVHKCIVFKKKFDLGYFIWLSGIFYELFEIKHFKNFICRTHWDSAIIQENNPNARIFKNWELIRSEFFLPHQSGSFESNKLVFLGGSNQMKGILGALKIISHLNKYNNKFELIIIGHGSLNEISKLIKKNKLNISEDQIEFLGFKGVDDIVEAFKGSFCLIHPTMIDNSPNTICEAQIFGLPVIANNVGGISSLIEQGKTGILVDDHNYELFVSNILKLKADRNLYFEISKMAKEIAFIRHNPDSIMEGIKNIYSELTIDNLA
jgi:glycosyltransferase involved in cell wall biosynthesis